MELTKLFKEFVDSGRAGGVVLLVATVVSLIVANSSWGEGYIGFWNTSLGDHTLAQWINDGLMAVFFLLIGLELEREFYQGELSDIKNALLPIFGALGGMIIPAGIFLLMNYGPQLHYQVANVALITPLRDGMNLVAKEYIASRINDDGVLRKVLLLDYDGTLVPIESIPRLAQPGKSMMDLLHKLTQHEATDVVIVSGRTSDELEGWFKDLDVHLVAEHGASVKMKRKSWRHLTTIDSFWKPIIRSTFESFVDRSPGSFIEEKKQTIAWHYRNVERQIGFIRSRELLDNLHHLIRNTHLNVLDGHKVIEVRAAGIDKGKSALSILGELKPDFVLAIGDDKTDEDVFYAVGNRAITVKVGSEVTCARYCLPRQEDVTRLLGKMLDDVP